MPRKSREREREQQRKESKRQRVDIAESATSEHMPQEAAGASEHAPDPAALQLMNEIAAQLGETEDEPRATILRAVQRVRPDMLMALLEEVLAIEASGGMMLGDGSRRRSPGGVFFRLLRQRTDKPDRLAIFYPDYQPITLLNDDQLRALLADAPTWPRATPQRVRLRLAGRPGQIPAPDLPPETPYVIFNLESGPEQAQKLPGELPPVAATTTYRVLAATAQWRKIAAALIAQPDAHIGVVGLPAINPKRPGVITVRATGIMLLAPRADESRVTKEE